MLSLQAPAKLNLTLEVLGPRPDGYHQVCSLVQAVALYDTLTLEGARALTVEPGAIDHRENCVLAAARLLQGVAGEKRGARVHLKKGIPGACGLGGHSSDEAAALRGLDQLWGLGLGRNGLLAVAQHLSSDAPFFLFGGTALVEGRGEQVTPLPTIPTRWVVILVPPLPVPPEKTRHLYQSLKPSHFTQGEYTRKAQQDLLEGREPELFNVFEGVATLAFPGLEEYRARFRAAGAAQVQLAGSGPALFTWTPDQEQAQAIYTRLQGQGLEAYLAPTLAPWDAVRTR